MAGEETFLGEIEATPMPGPYADAIRAAEQAGMEYWGTWNTLAFHPTASYHLGELSRELMRKDAPISAALRESIAAYTSSLNRCGFCMHAHAVVAAHLYGDTRFVLSHGVRMASDGALQRSGARIAHSGYSREQPTPSPKEHVPHA